MSKRYICDVCYKVINNPFELKMKEFYIGMTIDEYGCLPCNAKQRTKIHMCDDCYSKFIKYIRTGRLEEDDDTPSEFKCNKCMGCQSDCDECPVKEEEICYGCTANCPKKGVN